MKNLFTNLRSPAIISSVVLLPFMLLEMINRRNFHEDFPVPLFGILWLLQAAFIVTIIPLVQKVWAGEKMMANPIYLLLSVSFLVLIGWLWVGIIQDQMPCFLGVPNCD